jgi:hypothetical protein
MIITAYNIDLEGLESTTLTQYAAAAATSLNVHSNQGFANTNHLLIGEMGTENAELGTVNAAVTLGTVLPVAATTYGHSANEPVYLMKYNQVKFYRSTTGIGGTYSLLATVNMDVDNENLQTTYDDTGGTSSYYYKVSYYDSLNSYETTQSDPVQGSGYARNTVGFLINEIMSEIKDPDERTVSRDDLINWMNEVNDDLITRARKPYDFLKTSSTVDAVADTYIPYPTDMWKFDRFEYTWTLGGQGTNREFYPINIEQFRLIDFDTEALSSDDLMFIALDDENEQIKTYPKFLTTQTGAVTIYYYKTFDLLDSPADAFETPNPYVYKQYCLGKYFRSLSKGDSNFLTLSDRYFADYNIQVAKLQRANNKNVGTPLSFRFPTRRMQSWLYRR